MPRLPNLFRPMGVAAAVGLVGGCSGRQSALDPAGREAERLAELFWWMTGGAAGVWIGVVALTVYAVRRRPDFTRQRRDLWLIIGGGAAVPTVVLAGLLVYGLGILRDLVAPAPEGSLRIAVTGEQWWWRVVYQPGGADAVESANELRLPVGETVEFRLDSPDVIHAFWIPALGGKIDMIPGRTTRLTLTPTRTGVYRGVCAEYCGASHARMAFDVRVVEKAEFERWLAGQRLIPRPEERDPQRLLGRRLFFDNGCHACHTVRGTEARGRVGPDLTFVGDRLSLGAGTLPNDPEGRVRWLAHTDTVKPGVHMPHFRMLPADELAALAAYLEGLR